VPSAFLSTAWLCAVPLARTSAEQELLARGTAQATHTNRAALAQFESRDSVSWDEFGLKTG